MLKKFAILFLTLTLVLCFNLTAQATDQEELYAILQEELHSRLDCADGAASFQTLAEQFRELGYKESSAFHRYCTILADAEAGSFDNLSRYLYLLRLNTAFCSRLASDGYPAVDEIEAYALGRQAEAAKDWRTAISHYERSIAVLDSMDRLDILLSAEPTATPVSPAMSAPIATASPTPAQSPTPAASSTISRNDLYLGLQAELYYTLAGEGGTLTFRELAIEFENLGAYRKSACFHYYVSILADAESERYDQVSLYATLLRLDADFLELLAEGGYPTVDEIEAYALGRKAEAAGNRAAAIDYYRQCISVMDSVIRLEALLN